METPPIPPSGTLPPEPPPEAPLPLPPEPGREERTWAMVAHLSALTGHFIPFGHIFGPLIIWLIKRDEFALVDDQGKEALNAQISFTIYFAVSVVLMFIFIGFFLFALLWLADLILVIIAAVAANEGRRYRYPFILRLVQ